jgi:hypothetical protein
MIFQKVIPGFTPQAGLTIQLFIDRQATGWQDLFLSAASVRCISKLFEYPF